MSDLPETVIVLTDGELNLAHFLDLLRATGIRVLATSRPYELMAFLARYKPEALVLRAGLIPDPADGFVRQIRGMDPRPFLVVTTEAEEASSVSDLADLTLGEPFRYSSLEEALRYGKARARGKEPATKRAAPAQDPRDDRADHLRKTLVAARRLSELERDRDGLCATALEQFLDLLSGEDGGLYMWGGEPPALSLVRATSGFPAIEAQVRPLSAEAGASLEASVAGGMTGGMPSTLVVPVVDQRRCLGVLALVRRRGGESYVHQHIEVARPLASHFAVTLGNALRWEDAQRLAVIDPLTGLYNRRFFERQITIELERARRYDRQVTLALLDIDNFKIINDLNGYSAGDQLIRATAEIIRKSFREVDVVTRWGGDEFAVLLPETAKPRVPMPGESGTLNFVERVRRAVESTDFRTFLADLQGRVTISAGVATFPTDARDKENLFQRANQALRRAKRMGHNRVCVAGEDLHGTGSLSAG